jgi:propanediol dehydratase small subunit
VVPTISEAPIAAGAAEQTKNSPSYPYTELQPEIIKPAMFVFLELVISVRVLNFALLTHLKNLL